MSRSRAQTQTQLIMCCNIDVEDSAATSQLFLKSHSPSTPWKVVPAQEFPIWPLAELGASVFVRTCSCPPPSTSTKTLPSSYLELKIRPLRHQSSSLSSITSWTRQFRAWNFSSGTQWRGSITLRKLGNTVVGCAAVGNGCCLYLNLVTTRCKNIKQLRDTCWRY